MIACSFVFWNRKGYTFARIFFSKYLDLGLSILDFFIAVVISSFYEFIFQSFMNKYLVDRLIFFWKEKPKEDEWLGSNTVVPQQNGSKCRANPNQIPGEMVDSLSNQVWSWWTLTWYRCYPQNPFLQTDTFSSTVMTWESCEEHILLLKTDFLYISRYKVGLKSEVFELKYLIWILALPCMRGVIWVRLHILRIRRISI